MINKTHYLSHVLLSPWPLLASFGSFNLLFSLLLLLKFGSLSPLMIGLSAIFHSCFIWWFFYSGESICEGAFSLTILQGLKLSMLMFISSEVFFFFSFFWSYFHFSLAPTMETGLVWPPYYLQMFDCLNVPLINTLLLLSSGVTATLAHGHLLANKMGRAKLYLGVTIFLGVLFTICQVAEYFSSFFSISDSTFGTSFFMLTGFHGIHVIIGTLFLGVVLARFYKFTSCKAEMLSFELASWYWHFVDVVWIFLYYLIYYCNN